MVWSNYLTRKILGRHRPNWFLFEISNLLRVLTGLSRVETPTSFCPFFPLFLPLCLQVGIQFRLNHHTSLEVGKGSSVLTRTLCHHEGPYSDPWMQPAVSTIFCMSLSFPIGQCLFVGTDRLLYQGEPVCTGFSPSFCPRESVVREEEFPLPFRVLLASIRIELTWDSLIGENQI